VASISGAGAARASVALLLLVTACGRGGSRWGVRPEPGAASLVAPVPPPLPLAQVYILEAAGSQPDDSVVSLPNGAGRVIVLRRSAPDFGLFATLDLFRRTDSVAPAAAVAPGLAGAGLRIGLRPLPGRYGLDLAIEGGSADSATITFSYGTHFVAPAGARERYGSNLAFEKALSIGRVGDDSIVVFLPTTRPGADMVTAPLTGSGRYVVAAPR
jgi:hypothetical protein